MIRTSLILLAVTVGPVAAETVIGEFCWEDAPEALPFDVVIRIVDEGGGAFRFDALAEEGVIQSEALTVDRPNIWETAIGASYGIAKDGNLFVIDGPKALWLNPLAAPGEPTDCRVPPIVRK